MQKTLINNKWELLLPEHRAARPEWPYWEKERLTSMWQAITELKLKFSNNLEFDRSPLVMDIGAEEGDFPALFASWGADVILFEPNPKVWPNIRAIWEANKLKDPRGYYVGFASDDDNHFIPDYAAVSNDGYWPVCAHGELIGDHGFKELFDDNGSIPQFKVDSFSRLLEDDEVVDIITIDVEGSEFQVLKGAVETIKKHNPLIYISIHPEFMFRMFGQYTAELVKFVTDLGYSYEILAFDHEFHFLFKPNEN